MIRRRLSSKQREALYKAEAEKAREAERGEHPICNIPWCDLPVLPGQKWDESHYPIPHTWGGTVTGIAHSRCNRLHGAKVVTPLAAKVNRIQRRERDITRSATPLPGGREDRLMRKMNGQTVERSTGLPLPYKGPQA